MCQGLLLQLVPGQTSCAVSLLLPHRLALQHVPGYPPCQVLKSLLANPVPRSPEHCDQHLLRCSPAAAE